MKKKLTAPVTLVLSIIIAVLVQSTVFAEEFVADEKADIVHQVADLFSEWYLDEEKAKLISLTLKGNYEHGKYESITDRDSLSKVLVDDMQQLTHDKHIQMHFIASTQINGNSTIESSLNFKDSGISRVAVLPGNIGRIKITRFASTKKAKKDVEEAFERFRKKNVNAIIIDLRDCFGGNSDRLNWVLSHFLPTEPVLLSKIYNRKMNIRKDKWSLGEEKLAADKRFTQPLYILTSSDTFSGGEAFAYALKHLKRAKIIGEKTGGGANMVTEITLEVEDEMNNSPGSYQLLMPFIQMINPITNTNWEGKGVIPDITVMADDAWEEAYEMAVSDE